MADVRGRDRLRYGTKAWAAVEDLDADGQMDIYNSSLGVDQLSYGRKDGSFEDVTFGSDSPTCGGSTGGATSGLRPSLISTSMVVSTC